MLRETKLFIHYFTCFRNDSIVALFFVGEVVVVVVDVDVEVVESLFVVVGVVGVDVVVVAFVVSLT